MPNTKPRVILDRGLSVYLGENGVWWVMELLMVCFGICDMHGMLGQPVPRGSRSFFWLWGLYLF